MESPDLLHPGRQGGKAQRGAVTCECQQSKQEQSLWLPQALSVVESSAQQDGTVLATGKFFLHPAEARLSPLHVSCRSIEPPLATQTGGH